MSDTKHVFTRIDDCNESVEYRLNGVSLITANHDDHGWAGMEAIESVIAEIAKQIGAEYVDEDPTDAGDDSSGMDAA